MKKAFNANEYGKTREEAKRHFLAKKRGEQDLFTEQFQLYKPIIESTKEYEKNLISGQHEMIEQIVPALRTRNLPQLEFDAHSSPIPKPAIRTIDLDGELLNQTHRENLQDMSLELPSEAYAMNSIENALKKINKMNRSLGVFRNEFKENRERTRSIQITKTNFTNLRKENQGFGRIYAI